MINLVPTTVKIERMYGRRNRQLLGYSIGLILTAVSVAAIMMAGLQLINSEESDLKAEINEANTEILALEGGIKEVEAVASQLETAKKLSDLSVHFSDLIPQIGAVLPEGVILNALSLTGGATDPLILDVDLSSADLAPVLSRNLVESDLFEAADISSLTPKGASEEGGTENYNFNASLTASFTGTAEAKKKEADAAALEAELSQQQENLNE